ncbi:MAG TPA: hypothetical protein VK066_08375 [Chloroflexota bacterium]|nr:hypothetical protein [Chloroflexota bacterium]
MRRLLAALLLAGSALLTGPRPAAHAGDIGDHPECQRQFRDLAEPYFRQMLWYANAASLYPVGPDGRPPLYSWPASAYGPLNGYGPGSPYGPAFGAWGLGSFGPGFGGPGGFGITPLAAAGWQFAGTQALGSLAALNNGPAGLSFAAVAAGLNAQSPGLAPGGGLGGPGTADLIALAALQQGEVGNVFAGLGFQQTLQANRIADASLRQAVVANRLAAAGLNADRTAYPLSRANDLYQVIAGIQAWVSSTCPAAPDTGV